MTKPNRTITAPAERYKAQADVYAALLRGIIQRYEDEYGLWCVHCQQIIKPMLGHAEDCIVRTSKRALAADDATFRAMAAEVAPKASALKLCPKCKVSMEYHQWAYADDDGNHGGDFQVWACPKCEHKEDARDDMLTETPPGDLPF